MSSWLVPDGMVEAIEAQRKALMDELAEAVAAEREACAKIADETVPTVPDPIGPLRGSGIAEAAKHIAATIRARGKPA